LEVESLKEDAGGEKVAVGPVGVAGAFLWIAMSVS
jgi:hypothetical protein